MRILSSNIYITEKKQQQKTYHRAIEKSKWKLRKIILSHLCLASSKKDVDSVDPDQKPQNAVSYQGLHCLHSGQKLL